MTRRYTEEERRAILSRYFPHVRGRTKIAKSLKESLQLQFNWKRNVEGLSVVEAAQEINGFVVERLAWAVEEYEDELRDVVAQIPWPEGHPGATFEDLFTPLAWRLGERATGPWGRSSAPDRVSVPVGAVLPPVKAPVPE